MFIPKKLYFETSIVKKEAGVFCCAHRCKSKPAARKAGLCHRHFAIKRRIADPVYDRYYNFKNSALIRNKSFNITLQEFRKFCDDTGYIIEKGKRGRRCTIDRIRNWEGYYIGNIQILTSEANVRKYHDHDKHFTELEPDDPDYLPF